MDKIHEIILNVEVYKAQKNFEQALKILQESIVKIGEDYRLYEEISDIYLYEGKLAKAKKAVDYALKINPHSATGNYLKGFILLSYNKPRLALKHLEISNRLVPNNAEILRNIGWAYCLLGEYERGILILKRALRISPGNEFIEEDIAMALIGMGKIEEGNAILQKLGKTPIET